MPSAPRAPLAYTYRTFRFRGAAIMGAISAIDFALWDIAGIHIPIAAGERIYTIREYNVLFSRNAMAHAESAYACAGGCPARKRSRQWQRQKAYRLRRITRWAPSVRMFVYSRLRPWKNFSIMESPDPSLIGNSLNTLFLPARSPGTHSGGSAKGRAQETGNRPYRDGTAPHRLDSISAVQPMGRFFAIHYTNVYAQNLHALRLLPMTVVRNTVHEVLCRKGYRRSGIQRNSGNWLWRVSFGCSGASGFICRDFKP